MRKESQKNLQVFEKSKTTKSLQRSVYLNQCQNSQN
jgi:hypothetical protein